MRYDNFMQFEDCYIVDNLDRLAIAFISDDGLAHVAKSVADDEIRTGSYYWNTWDGELFRVLHDGGETVTIGISHGTTGRIGNVETVNREEIEVDRERIGRVSF